MRKILCLLTVMAVGLSAWCKDAVFKIREFYPADGSTQISWITAKPVLRGTVQIKTPDGKKLEMEETSHGAPLGESTGYFKPRHEKPHRLVNHYLSIPAKTFADGTKIAIKIFHPDDKGGTICSATTQVTIGARAVPTASKAFKVDLEVKEPTATPRKNWFVRSGVPFPVGTLASGDDVVLLDENGKEITAVFEEFCHWRDNSVKWLIVSFNGDSNRHYTLTKRAKKAVVGKNAPKSAEKLLTELRGRLELRKGKVITVEVKSENIVRRENNAVWDEVEAKGKFSGSEFHWRLVVKSFANGVNSVDWQLISLYPPKDQTKAVKSFTWSVKPQFEVSPEQAQAQWHAQSGEITENGKTTKFSGHERANGFIAGANGAVAVRDFAHVWPKQLRVDKSGITIGALPELPENYVPSEETPLALFKDYFWLLNDKTYCFPNAMTLAGQFWIYRGKVSDAKVLAEHLEKQLFASTTAEYYCKSGAFGELLPPDKIAFANWENMIEKNFAVYNAWHVSNEESGWMSYGDWFGERYWNWGNNEYDCGKLCAMQFVRTGNRDYLRAGLEMTRHYTTIDNRCDDALREVQREHAVGHAGWSALKDSDKRLKAKDKPMHRYYCFEPLFDIGGGHDVQQGVFYNACLTGDRDFWNSACRATLSQALYATPGYRIFIERSIGWLFVNAAHAYFHTNNPIYLNEMEILFEAIKKQQNQQTGCMDLPLDPEECKCPDKLQHRGGKPFAVGVLIKGLTQYYLVSGDPEVKKAIILMGDWLMGEPYDQKTKMFRYRTGCPKYKRGTNLNFCIFEGLIYVSQLSGDKKYAEFALNVFNGKYNLHSKNGKIFTMFCGAIPNVITICREMNIAEQPEPQGKLPISDDERK